MESEKNSFLKNKKRKFALLLFIIIFFVGNISFYFQERAKWIYDEQPYPKAKEWLIPANMMLVYGTILTKLPFIDERSFIMKPIIGLQDYFVKKWQENLPDDDAEKYLGWYMFKLRTYMIPNTGKVDLSISKFYTLNEINDANEKAWKTIESMVNYKAKDRVFKDIKYSAFLNLAFFYMKNVDTYWSKIGNDGIIYTFTKNMYEDKSRLQKFKKLYVYISQIKTYYQENHTDLYKEFNIPYFKHMTMYLLTDYLLDYQIDDLNTKKLNIKKICNSNNNKYLKSHNIAKQGLIEIKKVGNKLTISSIDSYIKSSIDLKLQELCNKNTTKKIKKEERQWQTW